MTDDKDNMPSLDMQVSSFVTDLDNRFRQNNKYSSAYDAYFADAMGMNISAEAKVITLLSIMEDAQSDGYKTGRYANEVEQLCTTNGLEEYLEKLRRYKQF